MGGAVVHQELVHRPMPREAVDAALETLVHPREEVILPYASAQIRAMIHFVLPLIELGSAHVLRPLCHPPHRGRRLERLQQHRVVSLVLGDHVPRERLTEDVVAVHVAHAQVAQPRKRSHAQ
eukprot:3958301-Prymnesium_polylepis.1